MDAVVLAAGRGTRMGPLTDRLPKPLLPVAGRPLLEHILERAAPVVDRFVVVVGYEGDRVRSTIGERFDDIPVTYAEQPDQAGTADAVAQATAAVDGPFIVLNGDVLVEAAAIEAVAEQSGPAVLGTVVDDPTQYGVLSVDDDGLLTGIVEKPDDPPSSLINAGVYRFDGEIAATMADVEMSDRGELELTDAVAANLDAGVAVVAYDGFWLDVGYPWDLLESSMHVLGEVERRLEGEVHPSASVVGDVVVETDAVIEAGTVIEGPVRICSGARVGPNAYVRDGAVVGADARVGHAVEVKQSVLMDGATASHLSYIGDSVLGMDVNLGAGTTVANLRHDDASVRVPIKGELVDTGRRKFGVVCGHEVHTGINTSLNAGVVLPTEGTTEPGESVLKHPPLGD